MNDRQQGLPSETLNTLKELGVSLVNHANWTRTLHRSLLCNEDLPEADFMEDAHCRCRFGQWYYSTENEKLLALDGFQRLAELHKKVHDKARVLLTLKQVENGFSADDYDEFIDVVHAFRAAVQDLQYTVISEVCSIDQLTGVWNRYTMQHRLSQELERSRRTGKPSAIALVDFDHFKKINDDFGHIAGDAVLKNVVGIMIMQFREYDSIFRFGGEEFLLLFPETDIKSAASMLERLRNDIKKVVTKTEDGREISITISIGLSVMNNDYSEKEAIDNADKALLIAKSNGRDRLEVWG